MELALVTRLAILLVLATLAEKGLSDPSDANIRNKPIKCPPKVGGLLVSDESEKPDIYEQLKAEELRNLYTYLSTVKELNLAPPEDQSLSASHIFLADLHMPPKQDALNYLDKNQDQPPREAFVILFRGDLDTPIVQEIKVGAFPNLSYWEVLKNPKRQNPIPFAFRPIGEREIKEMDKRFKPEVDQKVGKILEESYGATLLDCGKKCLTWELSEVGSVFLQEKQRLMWLTVAHDVENSKLHKLDFSILVKVDSGKSSEWDIKRVYYSNETYSSLDELANRYNDSDQPIKKTKFPFPEMNREQFSTMNVRGKESTRQPQRPPMQIDLDGERFSVDSHGRIKYFDWNLIYRLSTLKGPQIHNVYFKGQRIVYEMGLNEISTYYSGSAPMDAMKNYIHTAYITSVYSKTTLVPEVACPPGSPVMDLSVIGDVNTEPLTLNRAWCVFEVNNQKPYWRYSSSEKYYFGMTDPALIMRTIIEINKHEFIVDIILRQSGTISVNIISTGYIESSFSRPEDRPYGFELHDGMNANHHLHMFSIKSDMDVLGTNNRVETNDIVKAEVTIDPLVKGGETKIEVLKMKRNLKKSEKDANLKLSPDEIKQYIVYNNKKKNSYHVPRAYRIEIKEYSPQLLTPGVSINKESSVSWFRYPITVTTQKDEEWSSSSPYAAFDGIDPVTNFTEFYADDDSLVDKDLVLWLSGGLHHIPHMEDMPTVAREEPFVTFTFRPYNFFKENTAVESRDNIRIELRNSTDPLKGLKVQRYGKKEEGFCGIPSLTQLVHMKPDHFVSMGDNYQNPNGYFHLKQIPPVW